MDPRFLAAQLVNSAAFRRLFLRTQAFADGSGTVSTAGTHSLEAGEWLHLTADRLGLDSELCRLMGLSHDLGKNPYGHRAEEVLHQWANSGFTHADHGVAVLELLEVDLGLDFGDEVKWAIRRHSTPLNSDEFRLLPLAEQLLGFADKSRHVTSDTIDALAAGVIFHRDLPEQTVKALGLVPTDWSTFLSDDLLASSDPKAGILRFSDSVLAALIGQKRWLVENVYQLHGCGYLEKGDFESVLDYLSHRDGRSGTSEDKLQAVGEFADLIDSDVMGIADMLVPEYVDVRDGKSSVHIGGDLV